ncbi:ThuA domain-containing protein [Singulisphaera rosea]
MTQPLSKRSALKLAVALAATLFITRDSRTDEAVPTAKPINALLITGGCCHDYEVQKTLIPEGISARGNVRWTVVHEGTTRTHRVSRFEKANWADGFDVVVHNGCFGFVDDREFVERVASVHRKGTPAVVIHCGVHTFRAMKTDEWREFLGVTSRHHGAQRPLEVKPVATSHPIMKSVPAVWKTVPEELYVIEKVWPETTPLAQAYDADLNKDHPVVWTHQFGRGRVFVTTLAHNNVTMKDPVYLDMVARGLLWACDKLDDSGNPKPGYGPAPRN